MDSSRLQELLRIEAERAASEHVLSGTLSARVRLLIAGRLADTNITSSHICRELSMSRRTMLRRLSEEGTSFREILLACRRGRAECCLSSTNLSVQEIAGLVGYSETAQFSRAFRRWRGMTPMDFRSRSLTQTQPQLQPQPEATQASPV